MAKNNKASVLSITQEDKNSSGVQETANVLPEKIYLKSNPEDSSFHELIENWILFKREKWKNKSRANYLLIRATLCTLSIAAVTCFLSLSLLVGYATIVFIFNWQSQSLIDAFSYFSGDFIIFLKYIFSMNFLINTVLTFVGAASVVFWRMNDLYRQQWQYCCSLYNDSLKADKKIKMDLMRVSLAIDLVVVDLWAHRSFQEMFSNELCKAVESEYIGCASHLSEKIETIKNGKLTEAEAIKLLGRLQGKLLAKTRLEFKEN